MNIHLSTNNGVPIYRQIVSQVKYLVASGRLLPSDEVPPIRVLAERLLINPNTVARAYRELEAAGILISRQGSGTYVSNTGSPLAWAERIKIMTERVDALLAESRQLDVPVQEVIALIKSRDRLLAQPREEEAANADAVS
ncbi:MAG TPA: GntR family transcriptional regulator [Candidatus Hydrogenedentes bacterium]|nr:GntR family transcriptional regulator [Candidatus Hydrogenedentota bacterium]HRK32996.1 GntR family transcriptional regulator [Candidatus Hydrogenedentota bacterium]